MKSPCIFQAQENHFRSSWVSRIYLSRSFILDLAIQIVEYAFRLTFAGDSCFHTCISDVLCVCVCVCV